MAKIVGVTGGIGSGKSYACEVFKILGVPVYHADIEAKKCYDDPIFLEKLRDVFGNSVFDDLGKADKAAIAKIVFNNPDELKKLNALIHPLVINDFREWVKRQNSPYVIQENAILFEAGFQKLFDKIICVYAPLPLVIERVMIRDNASREQVLARIQNQMDSQEKARRSDYVIQADNSQLMIPQILEIHKKILNGF